MLINGLDSEVSLPLRNRVALLTGAAGGIGRVMTRALLDDGHSVAAVDRDADSLERLKTSVHAAERLCPILANLSTEAGCTQAVKIALQRFGTIEVLIKHEPKDWWLHDFRSCRTTRPASMGSGSRPPAETPRFRLRRLPSVRVAPSGGRGAIG
jgi:short chain dehydrogenase